MNCPAGTKSCESCDVLMQVCHCIACRKTGGAYCVNLAAEKESLKVEGREHVKSYRLLAISDLAHIMLKLKAMPSALSRAKRRGSISWLKRCPPLQREHRDSHRALLLRNLRQHAVG